MVSFEKRVALKNLVLLAGIILLLAGGSVLQGADADIALLVSDHTYAYFTNAYQPSACNSDDWNLGTKEYKRYFMGWEKVLSDLGLTLGTDYIEITDPDVNAADLKKFKVLILSNNFWLDDSQTKAIDEWVRRGGHLLATFGSGYAGIEGDSFKFLKGKTNGLHELWGDPSAKLNSSFYLGNPAVKVQITQDGGPTNGLSAGEVLDYEYLANVLIQRPGSSRDNNAFFVFDEALTHHPAIFNNRHAKGLVVYYAFAPEYLISLAYDLAGHCDLDPRYVGAENPSLALLNRVADGLEGLMKSTLVYLLSQ